jgi:hypothetical protein
MFLTLTERFNFTISDNTTLWILVYQALLRDLHTVVSVKFQFFNSHCFLPDLISKSFLWYVICEMDIWVYFVYSRSGSKKSTVTLFNWHQNCRIPFFSVKVYTCITEKLTNLRIFLGIRCYDAIWVEFFLFVVIILVMVWDWISEVVRLMMGTWPVFRMMAERIWSCVVW